MSKQQLKKLADAKNDALADLQASDEQRTTLQNRIDEMAQEREILKEELSFANDQKQNALVSIAAKDAKSAKTMLATARKAFQTARDALTDHDELAQALVNRLENELSEKVVNDLRSIAKRAEELFFQEAFNLETERFRNEHTDRLNQLYVMYRSTGRPMSPQQFLEDVLLGGQYLYREPPANMKESALEIEAQLLG